MTDTFEKPSPPSFVVLRQVSSEQWQLLGEVRRKAGLTAQAAPTAAIAEITGGKASAGEVYAAVVRSEWLVAQRWTAPDQ
jgi:hypothetical protein